MDVPAQRVLFPSHGKSLLRRPKSYCRQSEPRKPWATKFDNYGIAPDDSFIMLGYGSPVDESLNKKKSPRKLSPEELKEECIARVRLIPNADPKFLALAEECVINTAYVHVVRDCQAVKRWDTSRMTLIGDVVFK